MKLSQWILLGVGVLLGAGLYLLPRTVVENEADDAQGMAQPAAATTSPMPDHSTPQVADSVRQQLQQLKQQVATAENQENLRTFALQLSQAYQAQGQFDSAARALETHLTPDREGNAIVLGTASFRAYEFTSGPTQDAWAEKAERYLSLAQAEQPTVEAQMYLALLSMNSQAPMAAINELRQLAQAHPDHRELHLRLSQLAMQTGQFDRAEARLQQLLAHHPGDEELQLYLGVALWEQQKTEQANQVFLELRQTAQDPVVRQLLEQYLGAE